MIQITFAAAGLVNLHTHPGLSEMIYVFEGVVNAGFVGTDNKLYNGALEKGHAVAFPRGVVHFSLNAGKGAAYAIVMFNNENPGAQCIPETLFGSSGIGDAVLAQGFGISEETLKSLKAQFKAKFGDV